MTDIAIVPPAFIFLLGAPLLYFLKGTAKKIYLLIVPSIALIDLALIEPQTTWIFPFLDYKLTFLFADRLSLVVGYIFAIIGFLGILYGIEARGHEHIFAFLYIGSSLGVVFAGDYFTLYVFWEIMAVASVYLIWNNRTKESLNAGFRYILMHSFGGIVLLAGIVLHYAATNSLEVGYIEHGLPYLLVLIGFGLNTAFVPLHTWLPDSYPRGTITGSVFLSVYTTKTGVYVLARTFPGAEAVAYIGGIMVIYGVVYALLQNDTRKLLSYHIVSQVGYMVVGIGVGLYLGVNGGIAHLFNNILYKTLLFMSMGAVIYSTGKRNLTELGGLWKKMPITAIATTVAALSISGAPLFNGFVSKGMVIASAHDMPILEIMLTVGSIGTFLSFLKLTYYVFFKSNKALEKRDIREVPLPMIIAMSITAFLCVAIGVYPALLLNILPYPVLDYHTYSVEHVVDTTQLLTITAIIFIVAQKYFAPHAGIAVDFDYIYRKSGNGFLWFCNYPLKMLRMVSFDSALKLADYMVWFTRNPVAAIEIILDTITVKILDMINIKFTRSNDIRERLEKRILVYPGNPVQHGIRSIGIAVLLAVIFLLIYLMIYIA